MGAQLDTEADGQPTLAADGDDQVSVPNVDDEDGVTLPATLVACGSANVDSQRLGGGEARRLRRLQPQRQLRRRRREDLRQPGVGGGGERPALQRPLHRHADDAHLRAFPRVDRRQPAVRPASRQTARSRTTPSPCAGSTSATRRSSIRRSSPATARDTSSCPAPRSSGRPSTPRPTASRPPAPTATTSRPATTRTASPSPARSSAARTPRSPSPPARRACSTPGSTSTATATGRPPATRSSSTCALVAGANNLSFAVPATATTNLNTVARFRFATAGGLSFTGLATDGEVEDHAVATAAEADVAITKTDGADDRGPRHDRDLHDRGLEQRSRHRLRRDRRRHASRASSPAARRRASPRAARPATTPAPSPAT